MRTSADSVSCLGRNTQGVRLIKVAEKERLIGVERVCEPEEIDDGIEYLAADGTQVEGEEADALVADDAIESEGTETNDEDQNADDTDEE